MVIIDVLDEFRTSDVTVILEHTREEFGGYCVKTKRRYHNEDIAREAFAREVKKRAPRKKKHM